MVSIRLEALFRPRLIINLEIQPGRASELEISTVEWSESMTGGSRKRPELAKQCERPETCCQVQYGLNGAPPHSCGGPPGSPRLASALRYLSGSPRAFGWCVSCCWLIVGRWSDLHRGTPTEGQPVDKTSRCSTQSVGIRKYRVCLS